MQGNSIERSAQLHLIFRHYDPEVTAVTAIVILQRGVSHVSVAKLTGDFYTNLCHVNANTLGAVVAILLGLFQVLLAVPIYFMKFRASLFVLPLIIGILLVTGGSFALACSKSHNRQLLKSCAYSNVASLLGALVAVCVYTVSLCTELPNFNCVTAGEQTDHETEMWTDDYMICALEGRVHKFFHGIVGSLLIYDIAAVILHSLLSYSAMKGLKIE